MNSKIATILNKLKSTRRQETVLLLNSGLLNTLSASLLVLLMISVVELLAHGDVSFRSILFGILILGFGVAFYYFLMPNFLRALGFKYNPDLNSLAIRVGKVYPDIEDKLANSLQLVSDLNLLKGTSGNLAEASFDNIYDKIKELGCNILIITENKKGVHLYYKDAYLHYDVPQITPVSTIGAGDSFNAGIIYAINKLNLSIMANEMMAPVSPMQILPFLMN